MAGVSSLLAEVDTQAAAFCAQAALVEESGGEMQTALVGASTVSRAVLAFTEAGADASHRVAALVARASGALIASVEAATCADEVMAADTRASATEWASPFAVQHETPWRLAP